MMKTTVRTVTVALVTVVAGTLAGCGGSDGAAQETTRNVYDQLADEVAAEASAAPSTTAPTAGPTTGPTMGPTTGPTMGPATGPTMGPATGPTMGPGTGGGSGVSATGRLVPPGATVVGTKATGEMVLVSSGFDALVAYYEDVLTQMGAQGSGAREGTVWGYVGTYDGRDVQVEVAMIDAAGNCRISVNF